MSHDKSSRINLELTDRDGPSELGVISDAPKSVYALPQRTYDPAIISFDAGRLYLSLTWYVGNVYGDNERKQQTMSAAMTPTARGWLISQLPVWWDWEFALGVLAPWDYRVPPTEVQHGRVGRFTIPSRSEIAATEWSALHLARVWKFHPAGIQYEPDVRLIYANKPSRETGSQFNLWSDGRATGMKFYHPENAYHGEIELAPAAARLISVAIGRRYWRDDNRWRPLMMVASYESEVVQHAERGRPGDYGEKRLERIHTDTGLTLWKTSLEGGHLGEDGETWEDYDLFDQEAEARRQYKELVI